MASVWEYVRDEVLEAKGWKFATRRVALGKHDITPPSGYGYAYILPTDFLRFADSTEDDPSIYPAGYPYKVESAIVSHGGSALDFNPVTAYTAGQQVKLGKWVDLDFGNDRHLYVAATYNEADVSLLKVAVNTAGGDTLAAAASGDTITVSLANTTPGKNTGALIQAVIRALTTVDGISVASWTVTENAAYVADRPISASIGATGLGNLDRAYENTLAGTTKFPPIETTYWEEITPSAQLILVTDYDNETENDELIVRYIMKISDPSTFSGSFINSLAFRLAAEVSLHLTEGMSKFKAMMELYYISLKGAEEINQSMDYFQTIDKWGNESNSWAQAVKTGAVQGT
jgi:hypothetical protein